MAWTAALVSVLLVVTAAAVSAASHPPGEAEMPELKNKITVKDWSGVEEAAAHEAARREKLLKTGVQVEKQRSLQQSEWVEWA